MVQLPRNEKQTYRLDSRTQMWPSGLTLAMILTLNFQGQIFTISQLKMARLLQNEKQTYWLNSKASNVTNGFDLDHNLDLWILKVKCDLDLWPHTWPWPWIFMVKFEIAVSQNGRADWHCTKGVAVGNSFWVFLNSLIKVDPLNCVQLQHLRYLLI